MRRATPSTHRSSPPTSSAAAAASPAQPDRARAIPDRAPDIVADLPTRPDQAVIYRLCGDTNPLHVDPDFAKRAGFPAPILHGLCTYGIAARAIIREACGNDPARLEGIDARFSAPLFPGETVRTEIWRLDSNLLAFRSRSAERDQIVLDHGSARLRAQ